MSARYWVLVSDELLHGSTEESWARLGLRLADIGISLMQAPGETWCLVDDDAADPALDGRQVELVLKDRDGQYVIAERLVTGP